MKTLTKYSITALSVLVLAACSNQATSDNTPAGEQTSLVSASSAEGSILIADQGVFSAGGTVLTSEGDFDPTDQWEETGAGQTAHVDHANVFYQIPENQTGAPVIFLHGYGQSRTGWQSTPDGRDGWADMFLRDGHSVYLVDQPHRGAAGSTSVAGTISTKTLEQRWYTQFRMGEWVDGQSVLNEGSQFPAGEEALEQFFRQMTPDTGMSSDMGMDFDNQLVSEALAAVVDDVYARTGQKPILVTHSQGGGPGWTVTTLTENVGAIVAIEPGGAPALDSDEFKAIAEQKIPVTFYFGDYIDNGNPEIQATGMWAGMRQSSQDFVDGLVEEGVTANLVNLPDEGITGNTHFIFQDLNNDVVYQHIQDWLQSSLNG